MCSTSRRQRMRHKSQHRAKRAVVKQSSGQFAHRCRSACASGVNKPLNGASYIGHSNMDTDALSLFDSEARKHYRRLLTFSTYSRIVSRLPDDILTLFGFTHGGRDVSKGHLYLRSAPVAELAHPRVCSVWYIPARSREVREAVLARATSST